MRILRSAALLVLLAGCTRSSTEGISAELQPPSGATKLHHAKAAGFERVDYAVSEPFPPRATMTQLITQIERAGWHPLSDSPFNPGEKTAYVEGWRKRVVSRGQNTPKRWAYLWWSHWQKDDGSILGVALSYTYPYDGKPNLADLSVDSNIMTRERWEQTGIKIANAHRVGPGTQPVVEAVVEEPQIGVFVPR